MNPFSFICKRKAQRLFKPLVNGKRRSLEAMLIKRLRAESDKRKALLIAFSWRVIKESRIADACLNLSPDYYLEAPNLVESQALDFWVVTFSYRNAFDSTPKEDLFKLLDAAHEATIALLSSLDWNERDVGSLLSLLPVRYQEYDETFNLFLSGDLKVSLNFSQAVVRNIFGDGAPQDAFLITQLPLKISSEVISFVKEFKKDI